MVSSALKYRSQAPLLDAMMKEVGLDGSGLSGLTAGLDAAPGDSDESAPAATEANASVPAETSAPKTEGTKVAAKPSKANPDEGSLPA